MTQETRERLIEIRKALGVTQAALGKELGISPSTWTHIETTGKSSLTLDHFVNLVQIFQVNPMYIIAGQLPMFLADLGDPANQNLLVPATAQAGYAIEWSQETYLTAQKVLIPGIQGNARTFEIYGDSMMPVLMHGDWVSCTPITDQKEVVDGRIYVVVTNTQGITVKYIQPVLEGLFVIPENKDQYKPYLIEYDEVREIWEVKVRLTGFLVSSKHF